MDLRMPKPPSDLEIIPDPRNERRQRRRFSPEEKLRIVREAQKCTERGELSALLRREGLYASHLAHWRAQLEREGTEGLAPKKVGRKPLLDAKDRRIQQLERQQARLQSKLELAQKVIAFQVKAHEILGLALPRIEDE
jgi:transposase-like protein